MFKPISNIYRFRLSYQMYTHPNCDICSIIPNNFLKSKRNWLNVFFRRWRGLYHFRAKQKGFRNISEALYGGGEWGIRTPGPRKRSVVFKTTAFNHSANSPKPLIFKSVDYTKYCKNSQMRMDFFKNINSAWPKTPIFGW